MVTGLYSMDIWTTLVDVGAAQLVLSLLPGTVPFPLLSPSIRTVIPGTIVHVYYDIM